MDQYILTITTALPLLGILVMLPVSRKAESTLKGIAFAVSLLTFIVSLYLAFNFKSATSAMQFTLSIPWIPEFGIKYGTTYEVPIGSVVSEAMRRAAARRLTDEVKFEADLEACTIDFDINDFQWCANEKEADEVCTLVCTVRFLDHGGRNVYLRECRFRANRASAFDGKTMPRSIWECAIEIACRAVDAMSQEEGVRRALRR